MSKAEDLVDYARIAWRDGYRREDYEMLEDAAEELARLRREVEELREALRMWTDGSCLAAVERPDCQCLGCRSRALLDGGEHD